jgi:hypothetical protein
VQLHILPNQYTEFRNIEARATKALIPEQLLTLHETPNHQRLIREHNQIAFEDLAGRSFEILFLFVDSVERSHVAH